MEQNALQNELTAKIVELGSSEAWSQGFKITESKLAKLFGVSRTPIRAALTALEEQGLVKLEPNKGFLVCVDTATDQRWKDAFDPGDSDIRSQLISDRAKGRIPKEVKENQLTARYETTRGIIRRILIDMSVDGIVRRLPGHGWAFADALDSPEAVSQSYSFRIAVETASFLEVGFHADRDELDSLMRAHSELRQRSAKEIRNLGWFDVNTRFHETLAHWSGNSFILDAVKSQNRLRRLKEASVLVTLPDERIHSSVAEHISVLEAIAQADGELASLLLRKHLQNSLKFALDAFSR